MAKVPAEADLKGEGSLSAFPEIPDFTDMTIPSIFVDRFAMRTNPTNSRLTFGETIDGQQIRHTVSVTMTPLAAQQLSLLIREVLTRNGLWREEAASDGTAG